MRIELKEIDKDTLKVGDLPEVAEHMEEMMKILKKYRKE